MKKFILVLALSLITTSSSFAAQLETQVVDLNHQTLPKNAVRVPFVQLNLTAIDGPIEINSLTVTRTGLSSNEDFGSIWAETKNYKRTQSRELNNDDVAELSFRTPLLIEEDQTETLTIYANLEFESGGRTGALSVTAINHTGTETTAPQSPEKELPVITESQSHYDRTKFKIRCVNQQCQLVPRN